MPQDQNPYRKFSNQFPSPTPENDNPYSRLAQPEDQEENPYKKFGGTDTTIGGTIQRKVASAISSIPGAQATISTIAPALDFISRPNYAVSRFLDSWADDAKSPLDAVAEGFTELFGSGNQRQKLSMSDVIRRRHPDFALTNPNATQVLGFVGDVALDPLSWLGVGTVKNGIQVGGKTLTKNASKAVKEFIPIVDRKVFIGLDGTLETVEAFPKITQKAKRVEDVAEAFVQRASKSQVVDDSGELLPLYHGTDAGDFKSFKTKGDVDGVYFTTDPTQAELYAGQTGRVIKAYSTADNILDLTNQAPQDIINLATKLQVTDPLTNAAFTGLEETTDIVNAIRNKLSNNPLEGQKALVKELRKVGYKGMSFASDDAGVLAKQYLIFNNKDIEMAFTSRGTRAQEKVTKRTGEIGKLDKAKQELATVGYFDEVTKRQDEVVKFLNQFTDNPTDPNFAKTIAESEIIRDLEGNLGQIKPRDVMYENQVTERLYERMGKLVETNPSTIKNIFEPKGVYLNVGLPFTQQKSVLKLFGLEGISSRIKAISTYINNSESLIPKSMAMLGRTFNRDAALPKEYIKFRDELENELGYLSEEMARQTRKLFKDTNTEGRERIGNALHNADDETRKLEQIRATSVEPNFRTLTDGEAAQIFQQSMDKFKLTPEERAIGVSIQQAYKESAALEMRAGLLKSNLLNYSARGYEIIDDVEDMSLITRGKYGSSIPQPYLASSKTRKFLTKSEAEAAGLVPELDAALLYAHRVLSSKRALSIQQFKDSVTELFGDYAGKGKIAHTGILPTALIENPLIPKRVLDDMKMIGDSIIPSGMNESLRFFLRGFDRLQGLWKRGVTTVNPTFGPKQLVSNTLQSALVTGIKAFKAFDPRVALDTAIIMMKGGKNLDTLPPILNNWITRNFTGNEGLDAILANRTILSRHLDDVASDNFLEKFKKTTALGQTFTGTELVALARENGIIRGFDSTGEAFSQKVQDTISREANSFKGVVGELSKFWKWPSMTEDYSRMMLFLNGIGMGYTAGDAAKIVNKALFDYSRGLSFVEKNIIRRIIPFYSFQRFAIPFVLKQTLQQPGNLATIEKLMRTTEKLLLTGEELNPAEVDTFNQKGENFILEQPRLLSGFDQSGTATLNLLNNLTPYDVLNLSVYDKQGEIDIKRSAEKVFLAAMTPFLKVPIETLANKDFFTDRTIQEAYEKIPGNLDEKIGGAIPQWARKLTGFEVRKNEITGKTSTYINPYISYYAMQFIPQLRQIIKPVADVDLQKNGYLWSPVSAAMKYFSPINTKNVDLQEMNEFQQLNLAKDIKEMESAFLKSKIRGDRIGGDTSFEFEDNLKKLQMYLQTLDEVNNKRQQQIRGQGIGGAGVNAIQSPSQVPTQAQVVTEPTFR